MTKIKKIKAEKVRNNGTMTESAFWSMIRSLLRNKSRFWLPRLKAIEKCRRKNESTNKRLKWEVSCNNCKNWFPQKEIEVHHSIEAGTLKSSKDLPGFVERLFAEEGWICLCKNCHKEEHT